jgi:transcriptional regulator GlxA family with amidase domain
MLDPVWTKHLIESARRVIWAARADREPVSPAALLKLGSMRVPRSEVERLILLGVVTDIRQKLARQTGSEGGAINDVIRYVSQYSRNPKLSRATVARAHRRSDSWVAHRFKAAVGASFAAYLSDLRVTDGADLLQSTNSPVKEIALTVGFNDVGSFPRLFKRRFEKSPTQWRNAQRAEADSR